MTKIRIAGFGGQGIVLAGELLAFAAVLDGKEGSAISSYGSAARGGLTSSEIIISDGFIAAPFAEKSDILIAMSQDGFDAYIKTLDKNGIPIVDSSMVQSIIDSDAEKNTGKEKKLYLLPATAIATEELRSAVVTNMVMLGALSAITKIISKESLINATKETIQKRFLEINIKGIEIGYKKGIEIKG